MPDRLLKIRRRLDSTMVQPSSTKLDLKLLLARRAVRAAAKSGDQLTVREQHRTLMAIWHDRNDLPDFTKRDASWERASELPESCQRGSRNPKETS